jgi:hypothetical protein
MGQARERIATESEGTHILLGARPFVTSVRGGKLAGAAVLVPAANAYGEAIELRFSSALTASQFQGIFLQVDTSVANTSTIRAAEFVGRQGTAVNVGTVEGIHAQAQIRSSGSVTNAYGVDGQISVFSGYSGTLTNAAALRAKFQTEGTITNGYGILIENEAVTGGTKLDAAIRVNSTGAGQLFDMIWDSTGTLTTVSGDNVLLFKFLADNGTVTFCRYDRSDNALVFATS